MMNELPLNVEIKNTHLLASSSLRFFVLVGTDCFLLEAPTRGAGAGSEDLRLRRLEAEASPETDRREPAEEDMADAPLITVSGALAS